MFSAENVEGRWILMIKEDKLDEVPEIITDLIVSNKTWELIERQATARAVGDHVFALIETHPSIIANYMNGFVEGLERGMDYVESDCE